MIFTISHPTFDCVTLVAVDASDERIIKWIKNKTNIEIDDEMIDAVQCNGNGKTVQHGSFTMIRLREWCGNNNDIAILSHEAFHLAEFIFNRIGVPHHIQYSGEVYAYFIQSTMEKILDRLNKDK